ncbi:MAG UNVERIFIED_CONTAM: hypothetical protein LVR18_03615 [Planctomycetaceae bacterium]
MQNIGTSDRNTQSTESEPTNNNEPLTTQSTETTPTSSEGNITSRNDKAISLGDSDTTRDSNTSKPDLSSRSEEGNPPVSNNLDDTSNTKDLSKDNTTGTKPENADNGDTNSDNDERSSKKPEVIKRTDGSDFGNPEDQGLKDKDDSLKKGRGDNE